MQELTLWANDSNVAIPETVKGFLKTAVAAFQIEVPAGVDTRVWLTMIAGDMGTPPEVVLRKALSILTAQSVFKPKAANVFAALVDAFIEVRMPVPGSCQTMVKRQDNPKLRPDGIVAGFDGRPRFVDQWSAVNIYGTPVIGATLNTVIDDVPAIDAIDLKPIVERTKGEKLGDRFGDHEISVQKLLAEIRVKAVAASKKKIAPDFQDVEIVCIPYDYVPLTRKFLNEFRDCWGSDTQNRVSSAFVKFLPVARQGYWRTGTDFDVMLYGRGLRENVEAAVLSALAPERDRRLLEAETLERERDERRRLAVASKS